jgi:RNA polymerase sigma factor (sigma-70 family)
MPSLLHAFPTGRVRYWNQESVRQPGTTYPSGRPFPFTSAHSSARLLDFGAPARLSVSVSLESDCKARFGELMTDYAGPIRRLCAAYAASAADREDLFQDIFLAVWRALPAFRGDSSARTWLYRIAHNVALTWQARDRRRQFRETALDAGSQPFGQLDLRSLALKQAIAGMSPADRTLTLLWLEGLSAAEIEDVTGVKSATVAVRLSRIRKQLSPAEVTR